jgi:PTS system, glucose subfamily, IIA component
LFGWGKEKIRREIKSPMDGTVVPIDAVPDEVFATRVLGDGAAVMPASGMVFSPVNGVVENIVDTLHAVAIRSDDGLELIVHVGLDTVKLKGQGFTVLVKEGDKVQAGDTLIQADLTLIRDQGYELHTPVIITNMDKVEILSIASGTVTPTDALLTYRLKK